jgi:Tol biopolymer transport system component
MDADGSHQFQLTFNKHWDGIPAWSPDSWPILFGSYRDGSVEMVTMTTP